MPPPTSILAPKLAHLTLLAALVAALASLAGPQLHADSPWQSASAYWEAYSPDDATEALYHLDDATTPVSVAAIPLPTVDQVLDIRKLGDSPEDTDRIVLDLDMPPLLDDVATGADHAEPATEARAAANAVKGGEPALLLNDATCKTDTRNRGYLDFASRTAGMKMPVAGGPPARTLEFWLRLRALPDTPAKLVGLRIAQPQTEAEGVDAGPIAAEELLRWEAQPDGTLRALAFGQPIPMPESARLAPRTWTHLAVCWGRSAADEDMVRLYVNGRELCRQTLAAGASRTDTLTIATIGGGNDHRTTGWQGQLDEVRLSTTARSWYQSEFAPTDRALPQPESIPAQTVADVAATMIEVTALVTRWTAPEVSPYQEEEPAQAVPAQIRSWPTTVRYTFSLPFDGGDLPHRIFIPLSEAPRQRRDSRLINEQPRLFDAAFPFAVRERGMRLGADFERPAFQALGRLDLIRGSLALWTKPDNWDTLTQRHPGNATPPASVTFFRLVRVDQQLYLDILEHTPQPPQDMIVLSASLNPTADAEDGGAEDEGPPVSLQPGVWTHVIVTWAGPKVAWYINGKPHPTGGPFTLRLPHLDAEDPVRRLHPDNWGDMKQAYFQLGPGPESPAGTPSPITVIDEFRIFSEPLSVKEAADVYEAANPLGPWDASQTQAIEPKPHRAGSIGSSHQSPSQYAAQWLQNYYRDRHYPGPSPWKPKPGKDWPRKWH